MNQSLLPMIMDESICMIKVRFPRRRNETGDQTTYAYLTSDSTIQVGDQVLVYGSENSIKAVEVVEVGALPSTNQNIEYKFIISKVDFSEYEANQGWAKKLMDEHSKRQFDVWRKSMREQYAIAPPSAQLTG